MTQKCFCIAGPALNSSEKLPQALKQRNKLPFCPRAQVTELFLTLFKSTPKIPPPFLSFAAGVCVHVQPPKPKARSCSLFPSIGPGAYLSTTSITRETKVTDYFESSQGKLALYKIQPIHGSRHLGQRVPQLATEMYFSEM